MVLWSAAPKAGGAGDHTHITQRRKDDGHNTEAHQEPGHSGSSTHPRYRRRNGQPSCEPDPPSATGPRAQCWDTWKQVTSYWDTTCELPDDMPPWASGLAWTAPAVPPGSSLKAEPRAAAAFPGLLGAVLDRSVWLGCPVPERLLAPENGITAGILCAAPGSAAGITRLMSTPFLSA